ncbi:ABC transporter ATP-binding protein/permease [Entomoplasma ellychniae]|uniref:ABC transporter ATP-binding protein/permease n=1 Tax=Entomoplasma ellychniae TaxID=2114 RepID=A0A8E2QVP0_9MOLU|nr:ABC transporter ATP-binding protein [Entomoplasma ellychniae]PPE04542.1 ABC transporter ATP-binding protein/permease [Entomoplasma ellychniae]
MKIIIKQHFWLFLINIFLTIVGSIGALFFAYFFGKVIEFAISKDLQSFIFYIIVALLTTTIAIVSDYLSVLIQNKIIKEINQELRKKYYDKILSDQFNSNIDTGKFINNSSNKISQLEIFYYESVFSIFNGICFLILSIVMVIYYNWLIFIITTFFSILVFLVPFLTTKKSQKKIEISNQANDDFLQFSKDSVKSYWNYWSLNKTNKLKSDLMKISNNYEKENKINKNFQGLQVMLSTITIYLIQIILITLISFFLFKNIFTVAIVVTLSQVTSQYIQSFGIILNHFIKYLNLRKTNNEINEPCIKELENFTKTKVIDEKLDSIIFKNFTFKYDETTILDKINLKIINGDKVLILGKSGVGKSTLLKQLFYPRLFEEKSEIFINDMSCENYDIRKQAVYIDQDIFLSKDTIWNNITLANPEINKEEVDYYLNFLQLNHLIDRLEFGLETIILDNMQNLSGGERQRFAILRGLVAKKPWMFLDEVNSALDKKTSGLIMNYLLDKKDFTIIMVAHHIEKEHLIKFNKIIKL